MATTEHTGLMTYVDENGNHHILHPVTTADAVSGLAEALADVRTAAQTAAGNAEKNAKTYADNLHFVITVEVPASGWSAAAPYTQTVGAAGILASDTPHYGVVYSAGAAAKLLEKEAFGWIDDLDTAADSVTFTCLEDKPAVNLKIQLEVNR